MAAALGMMVAISIPVRPFLMVPTVIGPIFAGYVYDNTGSYYSAFMQLALL